MASPHCINDLVVDISFNSRALAKRESQRLTRWLTEELLPELDRLFEQCLSGPRILRFERLEFDFGNLHASNYQEVITRQLLTKMRSLIQERSLALPAPGAQLLEPGKPSIAQKNNSALEQLVLFLRTGQLPWFANHPSENPNNSGGSEIKAERRVALHQQLLMGLLDHPGLPDTLIQIPEKNLMIQRLLKQFERSVLQRLLCVLAQSQSQPISILLNALESSLTEGLLNEGHINNIYAYLFQEFTNRSSQQAGWVDRVIETLMRNSTTSATLLLLNLSKQIAREDTQNLILQNIDKKLELLNNDKQVAITKSQADAQSLSAQSTSVQSSSALYKATQPSASLMSKQFGETQQFQTGASDTHADENETYGSEQNAHLEIASQLTEKQLGYSIAQAFIQGRYAHLQSLWTDILKNNKSLLQAAIKKYLPQAEVRQQLLVSFPESMLQDIFALWQPDLNEEATKHWSAIAQYLAQVEKMPASNAELMRELWAVSFNLAARRAATLNTENFAEVVIGELVKLNHFDSVTQEQLLLLTGLKVEVSPALESELAQSQHYSINELISVNPLLRDFLAQHKLVPGAGLEFSDFLNLWNALFFDFAVPLHKTNPTADELASSFERITQNYPVFEAVVSFAETNLQFLNTRGLGEPECKLLCEYYLQLGTKSSSGVDRDEILLSLESKKQNRSQFPNGFYSQLLSALIQKNGSAIQQLLFNDVFDSQLKTEKGFSALLDIENTQPIYINQKSLVAGPVKVEPPQADQLQQLVNMLNQGEINLSNLELNEALVIQLINKYLTSDMNVAEEYREDLFNTIMAKSQRAIHKLGYFRSALHNLIVRAPLDFDVILANNGKQSVELDRSIYEGEFIRENPGDYVHNEMARLPGDQSFRSDLPGAPEGLQTPPQNVNRELTAADLRNLNEDALTEILKQAATGRLAINSLDDVQMLQRMIHLYLNRIASMATDNRLRLLVAISKQASVAVNAVAYYQGVLQSLLNEKALDFTELVTFTDIEKNFIRDNQAQALTASSVLANDAINFSANQLEHTYRALKQGSMQVVDLRLSAAEFESLLFIALQNTQGIATGTRDYLQFSLQKALSKSNGKPGYLQNLLQALLSEDQYRLTQLIADSSIQIASNLARENNITQASEAELWRLLDAVKANQLALEEVTGSTSELEYLMNFFLVNSPSIADAYRQELQTTIKHHAQTAQNTYVFFRKIMTSLLHGQALDFSQADILDTEPGSKSSSQAFSATTFEGADLYHRTVNQSVNLTELSFERLIGLAEFVISGPVDFDQQILSRLKSVLPQAQDNPAVRHQLIDILDALVQKSGSSSVTQAKPAVGFENSASFEKRVSFEKSTSFEKSAYKAASPTTLTEPAYTPDDREQSDLAVALKTLIDNKFDKIDYAPQFFQAVIKQADHAANKTLFLTRVLNALKEGQLIDLETFGQQVEIKSEPEIFLAAEDIKRHEQKSDGSQMLEENNSGDTFKNTYERSTELASHSDLSYEQFIRLLSQETLNAAEAVQFQQLAQRILARADAAIIKVWLNADISSSQLQLLVQYLPSPALHKLLQLAYPQEYVPVEAWVKVVMDALALEVANIYASSIHKARWWFVLERVLFPSESLPAYLADFANQLADAASIDRARFKNLVERRFALLQQKMKNNLVNSAGKNVQADTENKFRSEATQGDTELLKEALLEGIHILNAGQVIAAPFLPRLFSMLQLTDQGQFVNMAAADRAAHLVQYMVTGTAYHPEYDLLLNKVVCGISTSLPLTAGVDITEQEKTIIEQMLTSMIQHWKILGSTSITGFRQTFLQRQGWLSLEEDGWRLRVQPGPFDMLLDQLPWNISIIKHGWMHQPLRVSWR